LASSIPQTGIAARLHASNNQPPATESSFNLFGDDGFTFGDIIDIVNPLQHIPIVSNIYRKITGDTIAPAMEITGGALFGGPIGAAVSFVTTAFQAHMKEESISTDPDSPYIDKENTLIAANGTQDNGNSISNIDYLTSSSSNINQIESHKPVIQNNWVLSSENIGRATNINTIKKQYTYQSSDGIVNPAHNHAKHYTDVITATKPKEKTVDIIIGSNI
jgi:hypothetical protein